MGIISLTGGFKLIPEGEYVFLITGVTYKEEYGKLEIKMQTEDGQRHIERFSLMDKNGNPSEGAYNAFSFFAKTAMDNFELEKIDPKDLVGHYMRCLVDHDVVTSNRNPDKTMTFVRLVEKYPATGFEHSSGKPAQKKAQGDFNLDDILS